jgi:hypothetical protein
MYVCMHARVQVSSRQKERRRPIVSGAASSEQHVRGDPDYPSPTHPTYAIWVTYLPRYGLLLWIHSHSRYVVGLAEAVRDVIGSDESLRRAMPHQEGGTYLLYLVA